MSLNYALFGDEYAMSALEQIVENDEYELSDDYLNEEPIDDTIDSSLEKVVKKTNRRKRKAGPDDVQVTAEEYQKTKDERLWQHLQDRLYLPLLKFLREKTKSQIIAEEAAATSWARANERIDEYDPTKSKFSTWLWVIAYRQCLYDMKIDSRIETISYDTQGFAEFDNSGNNYVCGEAVQPDNIISSVDYYMIDNKSTAQITELNASGITKRLYDVSINAISNIENPLTKSVIEMKLLQEATIKDISETLNITQSNVKNHLYKGKSELASKIKTQYPELYDLYLDAMASNSNDTWCA